MRRLGRLPHKGNQKGANPNLERHHVGWPFPNQKQEEAAKDDEQEKIDLGDLLKIGATLFGAPDPEKVAKRQKEMQILESLEYPGGKRIR